MFLGRHVLFLCQECSSQGIGKRKADSPAYKAHASGLYPTQAGYRRTGVKKYTLQGRLPPSPRLCTAGPRGREEEAPRAAQARVGRPCPFCP